MEVYASSYDGLTVEVDDGVTTYRKQNGRTLTLSGDELSGEVWCNGEHYYYEQQDGEIVLLDNNEETELYRFESSELGWDEFANNALTFRLPKRWKPAHFQLASDE